MGIIWNVILKRHQRYVGPVSYISLEYTAKSSRPVVVASESGVLAAVEPRNGDLCE